MSEPRQQRLDEATPLIYADKVVDIIYGISTSKIIFGIETGGGEDQQVQAVTIPTSALLVLAQSALVDLGAEPFVGEMEDRLGAILNSLRRTRDLIAMATSSNSAAATPVPTGRKQRASKPK